MTVLAVSNDHFTTEINRDVLFDCYSIIVRKYFFNFAVCECLSLLLRTVFRQISPERPGIILDLKCWRTHREHRKKEMQRANNL